MKIGAILLGGGYVILPILLSEIVEKRNLIEPDELVEYFAISQSLPGIIAANISMFIGYKLYGKRGALVAMLGIIFVPFLTIVLLASVLEAISANSYVQSVLWGVGVAVIAMIVLTTKELWQKSNTDKFFYLIFILALLLLFFAGFSPLKTILVVTPIGVLYKYFITPKEVK